MTVNDHTAPALHPNSGEQTDMPCTPHLQGGELPDLSLVPPGKEANANASPAAQGPPTRSNPPGVARDGEFVERFGSEVTDAGFTQVPISLLRRLVVFAKLKPIHFAILIDLLGYWHYNGRDPFPGQATIAADIGAGKTAVKEAMARLESLGLIRRERRYLESNGNRTSDQYDLRPLISVLQDIAKGRNPALAVSSQEPHSGLSLGSDSGQEVQKEVNHSKSVKRECASAHTPSLNSIVSDEKRYRLTKEDLFE